MRLKKASLRQHENRAQPAETRLSTLDPSPESSYASRMPRNWPSLARVSSSQAVSARRWHAKRAIYDTLVAGADY